MYGNCRAGVREMHQCQTFTSCLLRRGHLKLDVSGEGRMGCTVVKVEVDGDHVEGAWRLA